MTEITENKLNVGTYKLYDLVLDNGLKVCIGENPNSLGIAFNIVYDVGSCREKKGLTGFAHLFEHLMFEGSLNVKKGEFFNKIFANGGKLNGFTTQDYTSYYENVPKFQIDEIIFMEADRMQNLSVNENNVMNQKKVVIEEKKQSYLNRPYGTVWLELFPLSYEDFAYSHTVIGEEEDILRASLTDVKDFYDTFYVPNNASIAIIGNLKYDEIIKLVDKHFGKIKKANIDEKRFVNEANRNEYKEKTITDNLIKFPAFIMSFHAPSYYNEEEAICFDIIEKIFYGGKSSRLYKKYEKENPYIVSQTVYNSRKFGTSLFNCMVINNGKISTEQLIESYKEDIYSIYKNGISDDEVEIAKAKLKSQYIFDLRQNLNVAMQVAYDNIFFNDILYSEKLIDKVMQITKEAVIECAKKYLTDGKLSLLKVEPS